MSRYIITLLILYLSISVKAQGILSPDTLISGLQTDTTALPSPVVQNKFDIHNTNYWHNNRKKKFAAYTLVGIGTASLMMEGLLYLVSSRELSDGNGNLGTLGTVWLGTTVAVMSASVPLFVSARNDRRRARSLTYDEYMSSPYHKRNYLKTGMRYEFSAGANIPFETDEVYVGWTFGAEGRSYIGNSNFDMAYRFGIDKTRSYLYGYDSYVHSETAFRLSAICDYNILKGEIFNPYVGVGLGVSLPASINFEPRIGIEIADHHRLSISAHVTISDKDRYNDAKRTSNFSLTYGYTL